MTLNEIRNLERGEALLLRLVYHLDEARRQALRSDSAADYQMAEQAKSSTLALLPAIRAEIKQARKALRPHHQPEGQLEVMLSRLEVLTSPPVVETREEYEEAEAA